MCEETGEQQPVGTKVQVVGRQSAAGIGSYRIPGFQPSIGADSADDFDSGSADGRFH